MKSLSRIITDIRNGENIDVYLTFLVCAAIVVLDLLEVVPPGMVTAAILLTLGLLSFGTLATRRTLGELNNSLRQLGGTDVELLDMKRAFPRQIEQRAREARKYILDTSLNRDVPHVQALSPWQVPYRRIRDERVYKDEIGLRRVEVIFHRQHLETIVRRLLAFQGHDFHVRHYDPPPQPIPILHIMSFDGEGFYLGGFYPSDSPIEQKAVYVRSKETNELLRDYWQVLWLRGKPLNEGGVIDWAELKRIGKNVGMSDEEFENMVDRVKAEVEAQGRQA